MPSPPSADEGPVARFGSAIEAVRTSQGWTRAEVCGWSGGRLAYSTLAGIENGHRAPGGRTMSALAVGLGIPQEDLAELWSALRDGAPQARITAMVDSLHDAARVADEGRRGSPGARLADVSEQLASAQATLAAISRSASAPMAPEPPSSAQAQRQSDPWDEVAEAPNMLELPMMLESMLSAPKPARPALREHRAARRQQGVPSLHAARVEELAALTQDLPSEDLDALIRIARSLAERRLPQDDS